MCKCHRSDEQMTSVIIETSVSDEHLRIFALESLTLMECNWAMYFG